MYRSRVERSKTKKGENVMNQLIVLVKMNLKLLFRNKGFLFFLFVLPLLSVLILNIKKESDESREHSTQVINELSDADIKIIYLAELDDSFAYYRIKVFDSSESELSDYVLNQLIDTGLFAVYRYESAHMTAEEILQKAKENAYFDRIGSIIYLSEDFEQEILKGKLQTSIQVYHASEDERGAWFDESFQQTLKVLLKMAGYAEGDETQLSKLLTEVEENLPDKKVIQVSDSKKNALTNVQKGHQQFIGYSYAIMTLSFLFCGIFIAYTVIEERENKVFTRIILSNTNTYQYIIAKLMVSVLVSIMQTAIMGIGVFNLVKNEFGISRFSYLFLIFMLGLIFDTLSLCIGVLMGDVMGANYAVFSIWPVSAMLSGLYFPIEYASGIMKSISNLMPQKWFMRAVEMMMIGDQSAYIMILYTTAAYLILILSAGAAGLKLKHVE